MERELFKRETIVKTNKLYEYLSIIFCAIAGASFLAYIIIVAIGGYWEQMFDFEDVYLYIFLIALAFFIPAIVFYLIKDRESELNIVLTDKRIYRYKKSTKTGENIKSYNLDKINNYAFYETKKGGKLKILTSSSKVLFNIDKEFYNEFVNAINNLK